MYSLLVESLIHQTALISSKTFLSAAAEYERLANLGALFVSVSGCRSIHV